MPRKKGPAENSSTGRLSTQLPQLSSRAMSGLSSPGPATYDGVASIITCIMQKDATNSRHSACRASARRSSRAGAAASGAAS